MSSNTKKEFLVIGVIAAILVVAFCCILFSTTAYAESAGVRTMRDAGSECAQGSGGGDCIVCEE